jgi:hypothetical protein
MSEASELREIVKLCGPVRDANGCLINTDGDDNWMTAMADYIIAHARRELREKGRIDVRWYPEGDSLWAAEDLSDAKGNRRWTGPTETAAILAALKARKPKERYVCKDYSGGSVLVYDGARAVPAHELSDLLNAKPITQEARAGK